LLFKDQDQNPGLQDPDQDQYLECEDQEQDSIIQDQDAMSQEDKTTISSVTKNQNHLKHNKF